MNTGARTTRSIPLEILRLVIWDHVECPVTLTSLCQVSRTTRELAFQKHIHSSIILFYFTDKQPLDQESLLLLCFPRRLSPDTLDVLQTIPVDVFPPDAISENPPGSVLEVPSASSQNHHSSRRLFYQSRMLCGSPIRHNVEISPALLRHPSFVRTLTFVEVSRALMKITPEPLRVDSFEAVILSMQNLVLFKWEFRDPATAPALIRALSTLSSLRDLVIWRTSSPGEFDEIPAIIEVPDYADGNTKRGLRSLTMQLGDSFDDSDSDDGFDEGDGTENDPVFAELWNLIIKNVSTFRHLAGQLSELIQLLKPHPENPPALVLQSFRFTSFQMSWDTALKDLLQREPPTLDLSHLGHLACGHSLVNNGAALRPFVPMVLPALRTLRLEAAFLSMTVQEFLRNQDGLEELVCNIAMTRQSIGQPWHKTSHARTFMEKHGKSLKRLLFRERLSQGMPIIWLALGMPRLQFLGISHPSYTEILNIMNGFKQHSSLETLYISKFKISTRPVKELLAILNGGLDTENPIAKTSTPTLKSIIVESDCGFKYFLRIMDGLWRIAFGGPADRGLDPMALGLRRTMMNGYESDIIKWCSKARVNS